MEDKDDKHHFSLKGIMDNEKKSKKQKKRREKEIVNDDFNVDLKDSRFDALFTSHHFAVDPSDPQYRWVVFVVIFSFQKLITSNFMYVFFFFLTIVK